MTLPDQSGVIGHITPSPGAEVRALVEERTRIEHALATLMEARGDTVRGRFRRMVKDGRERAGLTQQQLADAVGVARTVIANIEAGRQTTTLPHAVMLAQALGVSLDSLAPDEFRRGMEED